MKILILSVTTGYGHHSTANALAEELKVRGVDVVIVDLYEKVSKFKYDLLDKGYTFSIKHMKKPFGRAYRTLVEHESARSFVNILAGNKRVAKKFAETIQHYQPEVIISTHVLAAQVIDILKLHEYVTVPVFGIVTDYCIHPFWEDIEHIDYIVTGSEYLNFTSEKRGLDVGKILPLGLPVRAEFGLKIQKSEARRILELEDRMTILVMGGSMGYGNIVQWIAEIDRLPYEIQVICICGKNEKLYQRVNQMQINSPLRVLGFINQVALYMDAADCIITKPGGLTVTEVMCKRLPMILVNPIPGHEVGNAEFLTNCGAAIRVTEQFSVSEAVYYLLANPGRLDLMERSIELISHPDATQRICDEIVNCISSNTQE